MEESEEEEEEVLEEELEEEKEEEGITNEGREQSYIKRGRISIETRTCTQKKIYWISCKANCFIKLVHCPKRSSTQRLESKLDERSERQVARLMNMGTETRGENILTTRVGNGFG